MAGRSWSVLLLSLFFTYGAQAQVSARAFDKLYQRIDSLILQEGLPEKAAAEVNKVYALASKQGNEAEVIKALLYRISLQQMTRENAGPANIALLEKEISKSRQPAKSILQSITASLYWIYLREHRWQLRDRSEVEGPLPADISRWSRPDLQNRIAQLYLASVREEKLLQRSLLDPFNPILLKGNSRQLRPSVYDLLAHRALDYFSGPEAGTDEGLSMSPLADSSALAPAAAFARWIPRGSDSSSPVMRTIGLYQRLIRFHLQDSHPDALLDVDLERLQYLYDHSLLPQRLKLYRAALLHLKQQYANLPNATQASYLLALSYSDEAQQYQPEAGPAHRFDLAIAHQLCQEVLATPDSSEGRINCASLMQDLSKKELSLQVEKVNLPGLPFRVLLGYRNMDSLHYRIIRIDRNKKDQLARLSQETDYWQAIRSLPSLREQSIALPVEKDYRKHLVEIRIDSLSSGDYLLLASAGHDFSDSNNVLSIASFYVTGIAYVNHDDSYFVLDRSSGMPLARAGIQVWYRYYDDLSRSYRLRQGERLFTDANGHFNLSPGSARNAYTYALDITYGKDQYFPDDYTYRYYNLNSTQADDPEIRKGFLFTDRSIYRPGQTIYFKGILTAGREKKGDEHPLTETSSVVTLFDAGGKAIDSLKMTSNSYGSYHGYFRLPMTKLKGSYRLSDRLTGASLPVQVEEYKRPAFQVSVDLPEKTYRLNDSIQLQGKAEAFAGYALGEASVVYRIYRRTVLPYFLTGRIGAILPPQREAPVLLKEEKTSTDASGKFDIHFKAFPDPAVSPDSHPRFQFEIQATVTDKNGETHEADALLPLAYHSLELSIDLPDRMPADHFRKIMARAQNLWGKEVPAYVHIRMQHLQAPDHILRPRYWSAPDTFLLSEKEYRHYFLKDIYMREDDPLQWNADPPVFSRSDSLPATGFAWTEAAPAPGWYRVEASAQDDQGNPVSAVKYIELTGAGWKGFLAGADISLDQSSRQPGQTAGYRLETNFDSAWIIHHLVRSDETTESLIRRPGSGNSREVQVEEKDRGGIGLDMILVKDNRVYTDNIRIEVPFSNKQLNMEVETYRDHTQPGSEEEWKLKISGEKADPVAAEVLSTLYDASLDQLVPHQWELPGLWNRFNQPQLWTGDAGFTAVEGKNADFSVDTTPVLLKDYDRLVVLYRQMPIPEHKPGAWLKVTDAISFSARPVATMMRLDANDQQIPAGNERMKESEVVVAPPPPPAAAGNFPPVKARADFRETAFFFPDLHSDSSGAVSFSFRMPEALTRWKWMMLAHTRDLAFGYAERSIETSKELMVQPNAPRFLREGDQMDFSVKLVNLTDSEMTGEIELQLIDPETGQSVDGWFRNFFPHQYFTVGARGSEPVSFSLEIPYQYRRPVLYRVVAHAGSFSDGEEALLPVLSQQVLVTESLPFSIKGRTPRTLEFEPLLHSDNSETLQHRSLTVEISSNPAWYAVRSLPYLSALPFQNAEQYFNRYYAQMLAQSVVHREPGLKQVFAQWLLQDTTALTSPLQKNPELKSILLEETPWVLEAVGEEQQQKELALLFDSSKMAASLQEALAKLAALQRSNGGFSWCPGGPDDRYMTQYILSGIARLQQLGTAPEKDPDLAPLLVRALAYLDRLLVQDYQQLLKTKKDLSGNHLEPVIIQYLYMRSLLSGFPVTGTLMPAYAYYRKQAIRYWLSQGKTLQAMIALALYRTGEQETAKKIMLSLRQFSIGNPETGRYWKEWSQPGYYWYQSPIESQARMIELFSEAGSDESFLRDLRVWLLRQKQTSHWPGSRASADACYALLLGGKSWTGPASPVSLVLGRGEETWKSGLVKGEAGTGYLKVTLPGSQVSPAMGRITITLPEADSSAAPAWGAAYWQYFESTDRLKTSTGQTFRLMRSLFLERADSKGISLHPLQPAEELHRGDRIRVRIEISTDRDLEYVHLEDRRPSCAEPADLISGYRQQGGLSFYESISDAATHYFFQRLPKGHWVLEIPLLVTQSGTFSAGMARAECFYAPAFSAHSGSSSLEVEK